MSRRASAGFTLLELMVALAVAALAVTGLAHLLGDAAGLDARLGDRRRATGEAEALFSTLEQLLADPPRELRGEALRLAGGPGGPAVSGTKDAIKVLSRGPRVLGLPEPVSFVLSLDPGVTSEGGRVTLGRLPTTGAFEPEPVARAREFGLRYAAVAQGGDPVWTDAWSRPVAELALVEVSFTEAVSGRRVSRVIPVIPSLPRICALRPLLDGCPEWR